ncbi:LysR family transcriptional regulator [Zeaxanthinibacter enoshimensis]|uniref:DNA-binding transcriptional LysR family regulator n=1 Tax=Zeaxanthinibacter enoshimensis TaxID=392009 RepID=A0A4R6TME3_9FLAO|nr:LysR family transcriptional regulator [Zeaxanthinibacter enoshimensis]TDQ32375.1 DNA-binding transcriptional LysR family regulator [Zeaxanthinibacter enoshimensis]
MSNQLELRHLRYFLMVAEELHFRKAAEKLYISQPGLSRQIRQLEELLGTSLLDRNKKKVSLTRAGEYLKEEVEFLLNHIEVTSRQLRLIGEGHSGEVRIGFLGSAMQQVIPDLLVNLQQQYPDIRTSLEELSNNAQLNAIIKDRLDIGFVRLARVPEGLDIRPVFEDSFSLVLPEDHWCSAEAFKNIGQFSDENFILFAQDYSPLYYDTVMSICEQEGFSPTVSHKSVHAQTIFKLVENGLGISIVPTSLQHGFNMGVKFIELKDIAQKAVLYVIWKKDNRNQALEQCLNLLWAGDSRE